MGRRRAFDENAVLDGAMHAFRRRGYHRSSVRDLEEATGLNMGSIYHSFGDKTGLFEAAFAHYSRAVLQRRIDRYAPPAAGLSGLRDLFLSLLREPDGGSYGCLITNAAVEFGGDSEVHPAVHNGLQILLNTFARRLEIADNDGTLSEDVDPARTSVKLLALYQGILVLIRAGHDKTELKKIIRSEFDALEARYGS